MSEDSPFSIRAALEADARAVRMLLSTTTDTFGHILVAESREERRIIAAGGLTRSQRSKPLLGPGVAIHVVPPFRESGVAEALLASLAEYAKAIKAEALYATQKVDVESEAMRFWDSLGFIPCETVEHHELLVDQFETQLAPLYEKMRAHGKIPDSARIIPLFAADLSQVLQLHVAELGGDTTTLSQKLRGMVPRSFTPRLSKVLTVNDRVVGFILANRISREVAHVDANVVAPEVRGGWANVWLKLEATREAIKNGITTFVFTTFDHYKDTRSFTERLDGVTVRISVLMYLPLLRPQSLVAEVE
jgi:N-acetylglutamate synthase-like GNAT family acetyltransferase